jgi:DNA repair protein NreA
MKYCGRMQCPIILKSEAITEIKKLNVNQEFDSSAPSVFVGRFGYPKVNVGLLAPNEKKDDSWLYDSPKAWSKKDFSIKNVIGYRSSLINSNFKANIQQAVTNKNFYQENSKMFEIAQEVSQASRPVDLEFNLEKKPKFQTKFDPLIAPTGPNANLKEVELNCNPHIKKQVDKRVNDTDLLSNTAVNELYNKGYDENFLSKLLSMGNLGLGNNRKLVPTRWSITAVDDNVGKNIIEEIKINDEIENCLYFGGHLGNYFIVMFFENVWGFELFETYMPNASWNLTTEISWTTDFEDYNGRNNYAKNCTGGYYASRLPILSLLKKEKKQGSCLLIRFITEEYSCPLGVWVVREAVRKALNSNKNYFDSRENMIKFAKKLSKEKFNFDLNKILVESKIYNTLKTQKRLKDYI